MDKFYINDFLVDNVKLSDKSFTIQANDIGDLNSRQTSFSQTIEIEVTERNKPILYFLNTEGVYSGLPYQKLKIDWIRNSKYIVKDGWGIIKSYDGKEIKLFIQKGLIDFFKTIGNDTIGGQLDLSELNHLKTTQVVAQKLQDTNNTPFTYIIADYNGRTLHNNAINIDHMPPCINMGYILDKIKSEYGYDIEVEPEVRSQIDNTYITYPKVIGKSISVDKLIAQFRPDSRAGKTVGYTNYTTQQVSISTFFIGRQTYLFNGNNQLIKGGASLVNFDSIPPLVLSSLSFLKNGFYKLEISGNISIKDRGEQPVLNAMIIDSSARFSNGRVIKINESSNKYRFTHNYNNGNSRVSFQGDVYSDPNQIISTNYFEANNGEAFILFGDWAMFFNPPPYAGYISQQDYINYFQSVFKIYTKELINPDISEELKDFKISDFFKELLIRFGLTAYSEENKLKLWRLKDQIKLGNKLDWTEKFESLIDTETQNDYAQNNSFRYSYNDEREDHLDGSIVINNENLPVNKTVFKSAFYGYKKNKTEFNLNSGYILASNIYQMFDKEIKENNQVDYKVLDKRYHVIQRKLLNQPANIGSLEVGGSNYCNSVHVENQEFIDYEKILNENYSGVSQVLNDYQKKNVILKLSESDVETIDLSALYYFKQLKAYFTINKITYKKDFSEAELIKINTDTISSSIVPSLDWRAKQSTSYCEAQAVDECYILIGNGLNYASSTINILNTNTNALITFNTQVLTTTTVTNVWDLQHDGKDLYLFINSSFNNSIANPTLIKVKDFLIENDIISYGSIQELNLSSLINLTFQIKILDAIYLQETVNKTLSIFNKINVVKIDKDNLTFINQIEVDTYIGTMAVDDRLYIAGGDYSSDPNNTKIISINRDLSEQTTIFTSTFKSNGSTIVRDGNNQDQLIVVEAPDVVNQDFIIHVVDLISDTVIQTNTIAGTSNNTISPKHETVHVVYYNNHYFVLQFRTTYSRLFKVTLTNLVSFIDLPFLGVSDNIILNGNKLILGFTGRLIEVNLDNSTYTIILTLANINESIGGLSIYKKSNPIGNATGRLIYQELEEFNTNTGTLTGSIKDNLVADLDYVPPIENSATCLENYQNTVNHEATESRRFVNLELINTNLVGVSVVKVDWGDGVINSLKTHEYNYTGIYIIKYNV